LSGQNQSTLCQVEKKERNTRWPLTSARSVWERTDI